jgi:hypothetical protein
MTKRIQTVHTVGAMALVFILQACGGSNNGMTGAAGTTGSAGSGTGVAGTTGSAGATGVAGTTGAGGSATGTGGATAAKPSCIGLLTAAGQEPAKTIPCTPADVQLCTRTCGPEKAGLKDEMCTSAGSYTEMSGCTFDMATDFSCYKIPTAPDPVCPAGLTPQGSADCSTLNVPTCKACNSTQGTAGGQYLDSGGAAKSGYCVCQAADANGARKWSCASDNGSWPCPLGKGC